MSNYTTEEIQQLDRWAVRIFLRLAGVWLLTFLTVLGTLTYLGG